MDRLLKRTAPTQRVVHDVEKMSNLDVLIRGFHGIGNRLVDSLNGIGDDIGDGLHAIALALSTKEDNSAQILELANKVRAAREKLKSSIDKQTTQTDQTEGD